MNNYSLGNSLETRLADRLAAAGFWVHRLWRGHAGEQPADIIAVRHGDPFLIDCKVVSGKGFPFTRLEENQIYAMKLWASRGNGEGWFALEIEDGIYMISIDEFRAYADRTGRKSMPLTDIRAIGIEVEKWITTADSME